MKIISNPQRKAEIEKRLNELLETGTVTEGFYFSIGGKDFLFTGSWEEFGKIIKEALPFSTLETFGDYFSEPLLNKRYSVMVNTIDSKNLPIVGVDMMPRRIYTKEVAQEIEALQLEYQDLVVDKGDLK